MNGSFRGGRSSSCTGKRGQHPSAQAELPVHACPLPHSAADSWRLQVRARGWEAHYGRAPPCPVLLQHSGACCFALRRPPPVLVMPERNHVARARSGARLGRVLALVTARGLSPPPLITATLAGLERMAARTTLALALLALLALTAVPQADAQTIRFCKNCCGAWEGGEQRRHVPCYRRLAPLPCAACWPPALHTAALAPSPGWHAGQCDPYFKDFAKMYDCESQCYVVGCKKCEGPGSTFDAWQAAGR